MYENKRWDELVTHPLQSWEWGEFREKRQKISRVANFLIMWTKIKFMPWSFGYIPMGRIPNEAEIEKLKEEAKRQKAIGIRLEPNELKGDRTIDLPKGRHLFKPKTYWWNLAKSEEELLKAMHPKGRYNIKVAQKHNVSVRVSVRQEDFDKYLELMFEGTAKRQGIYSHSREYHQQMWVGLKDKIAKLFVAEYQGKIVAADIIFCFKDKIYYAYGASALEHKEVMAPTLLLWEIARWAKSQGYKTFDLWGAEEGKGFSRFKSQFGADLIEMAGTFDLPTNKVLYTLFRIAEEARWKILRILK